jgi:hypothetical protein
MSEKIIAASKSKRRIGCKVTSAANSGVMHMVQNEPAARLVSWYSGRYLPACRIIQIGGGVTAFFSNTDRNREFNSLQLSSLIRL